MEDHILDLISWDDWTAMEDIKGKLDIHPHYLSHLLKIMCEKGLIERRGYWKKGKFRRIVAGNVAFHVLIGKPSTVQRNGKKYLLCDSQINAKGKGEVYTCGSSTAYMLTIS